MRNLVKQKCTIVTACDATTARKHVTLGNDVRNYMENPQVKSEDRRENNKETTGRPMIL